jgi:hypothetical protein
MSSTVSIVAYLLIGYAVFRWWPLFRDRPRRRGGRGGTYQGQQTSELTINRVGLAGGVLLAAGMAPLLATWVPAAVAAVGNPALLVEWAPLMVTAVVVGAGIELGYRGLARTSGVCPRLVHLPIAVLLPAVVLAATPLLGQAADLAQAKFGATATAAPVPAAAGPADAATCTGAGQITGEVVGFSGEALANATTLVAVGKEMGVPPAAHVVIVATGMQESSLRNDAVGDNDTAFGVLQQRPVAGWGTRAEVTNVAHAARSFYTKLLAIPGWQDMPLWEAAQTVQRSAFPRAYDKWQDKAAAVVEAVTPLISCTPTGRT